MSNAFTKLAKAVGSSVAKQMAESNSKGACVAPGCKRKQWQDQPHCGRPKCAEFVFAQEVDFDELFGK